MKANTQTTNNKSANKTLSLNAEQAIKAQEKREQRAEKDAARAARKQASDAAKQATKQAADKAKKDADALATKQASENEALAKKLAEIEKAEVLAYEEDAARNETAKNDLLAAYLTANAQTASKAVFAAMPESKIHWDIAGKNEQIAKILTDTNHAFNHGLGVEVLLNNQNVSVSKASAPLFEGKFTLEKQAGLNRLNKVMCSTVREVLGETLECQLYNSFIKTCRNRLKKLHSLTWNVTSGTFTAIEKASGSESASETGSESASETGSESSEQTFDSLQAALEHNISKVIAATIAEWDGDDDAKQATENALFALLGDGLKNLKPAIIAGKVQDAALDAASTSNS